MDLHKEPAPEPTPAPPAPQPDPTRKDDPLSPNYNPAGDPEAPWLAPPIIG